MEAPLDLSIVFGGPDSDTSAIWPQLYLAGHVTTDGVDEPKSVSRTRRLRAPNLEVRKLVACALVVVGDCGALADQALAKRYASGLAGAGTVVWAVAFDAFKHAAVACS